MTLTAIGTNVIVGARGDSVTTLPITDSAALTAADFVEISAGKLIRSVTTLSTALVGVAASTKTAGVYGTTGVQDYMGVIVEGLVKVKGLVENTGAGTYQTAIAVGTKVSFHYDAALGTGQFVVASTASPIGTVVQGSVASQGASNDGWDYVLVQLDFEGGAAGGIVPDGSITTAKLANASLTGSKFATGGISSSAYLATGVVTSTKIGALAVATANIANGAITGSKFAAGGISSSSYFADGVITASQIADGTIIAQEIAVGAVTSTKIAIGGVTATNIGIGAVASTHIAVGGISPTNFAALSVETAAINTGAVTSTKIAVGGVTAGNIGVGAVTSTKIAIGGVTSTNLGALSVASAAIQVGAVTSTKIAIGGVTATNLGALAVDTAAIAVGAVTATKCASDVPGQITASKGWLDTGTFTLASGTKTVDFSATLSSTTGVNVFLQTVTATNTSLSAGSLTTSNFIVTGAGSQEGVWFAWIPNSSV